MNKVDDDVPVFLLGWTDSSSFFGAGESAKVCLSGVFPHPVQYASAGSAMKVAVSYKQDVTMPIVNANVCALFALLIPTSAKGTSDNSDVTIGARYSSSTGFALVQRHLTYQRDGPELMYM
jgi:hypothetical protein